mmetsp:Transcript_17574/g.35459  ORF Transcript_17574/g.35459 Transcript_17574/m.35459 type:complete len:322 (+) Transcript_17574:737-1702(+)
MVLVVVHEVRADRVSLRQRPLEHPHGAAARVRRRLLERSELQRARVLEEARRHLVGPVLSQHVFPVAFVLELVAAERLDVRVSESLASRANVPGRAHGEACAQEECGRAKGTVKDVANGDLDVVRFARHHGEVSAHKQVGVPIQLGGASLVVELAVHVCVDTVDRDGHVRVREQGGVREAGAGGALPDEDREDVVEIVVRELRVLLGSEHVVAAQVPADARRDVERQHGCFVGREWSNDGVQIGITKGAQLTRGIIGHAGVSIDQGEVAGSYRDRHRRHSRLYQLAFRELEADGVDGAETHQADRAAQRSIRDDEAVRVGR